MSLFWIGFLVWAVPFAASGWWMIQGQRRYLRLYHRRVNPDEALLIGDPKLAPTAGDLGRLTWNSTRILWQRQEDPAVEAARKLVLRRWWLSVVILFLGAPLPLIFLNLKS